MKVLIPKINVKRAWIYVWVIFCSCSLIWTCTFLFLGWDFVSTVGPILRVLVLVVCIWGVLLFLFCPISGSELLFYCWLRWIIFTLLFLATLVLTFFTLRFLSDCRSRCCVSGRVDSRLSRSCGFNWLLRGWKFSWIRGWSGLWSGWSSCFFIFCFLRTF